MNYKYLLQLSASHLFTSVRMYDKSFSLLHHCKGNPELNDAPLISSILSHKLLQNAPKELPMIFSVNQRLAFSWISIPNYYFLLGPIRFIPPEFHFMHSIELAESTDSDTWSDIPSCPLNFLAEDTSMLFNIHRCETEEAIDGHSIILANCIPPEKPKSSLGTLYQTIFEQVENNFAHNPYSHEKLEVTSIQKGDVDSLRILLKERFPGRYGKLSDDPLRQEIYLAIVNITLASRAAIEGGLHPETSYYLSDVSIQKIDRCKDPLEIIQLTIQTQMHYAQLVRELQHQAADTAPSAENQHITHCKDYIFAHLHEKLMVQDIANAVGLEKNYLSTLFKQCENKTLKQYIIEEKVKLIKNLLTFSTYSYIEIAAYLGFSSQSHMGMEFKRSTGMTLKEYRAKYRNDDFMNDSMSPT